MLSTLHKKKMNKFHFDLKRGLIKWTITKIFKTLTFLINKFDEI